MLQPEIKESMLTVVLRGDFNPHIFQPQWFTLQKLLGEEEGASAKVEIIHPEITVFNLDWLRFEVSRDRLVVTTKDDRHHEILRDLIIGTFTILSHTPLKMMGINSTFVYMVKDEATWHGMGNKLAPKDVWNKIIDTPGLRSLVIESKPIMEDNYKNVVSITFGPTNVKLGLRINMNDHYELVDTSDKYLGSSEIISILKDKWGISQKKITGMKDSLFKEL